MPKLKSSLVSFNAAALPDRLAVAGCDGGDGDDALGTVAVASVHLF
jgi:hypothetical protein